MTTINGQLWQACVECEKLVPAGLRTFGGLCRDCWAANAAAPMVDDVDDQLLDQELQDQA